VLEATWDEFLFAQNRKFAGHAGGQMIRRREISVDKLQTHGNILCQDSCSYQKLSSMGMQMPCREPWEKQNVRTEELMATKKKAAKKKKH